MVLIGAVELHSIEFYIHNRYVT